MAEHAAGELPKKEIATALAKMAAVLECVDQRRGDPGTART